MVMKHPDYGMMYFVFFYDILYNFIHVEFRRHAVLVREYKQLASQKLCSEDNENDASPRT
jgi:hypothetical protein